MLALKSLMYKFLAVSLPYAWIDSTVTRNPSRRISATYFSTSISISPNLTRFGPRSALLVPLLFNKSFFCCRHRLTLFSVTNLLGVDFFCFKYHHELEFEIITCRVSWWSYVDSEHSHFGFVVVFYKLKIMKQHRLTLWVRLRRVLTLKLKLPLAYWVRKTAVYHALLVTVYWKMTSTGK